MDVSLSVYVRGSSELSSREGDGPSTGLNTVFVKAPLPLLQNTDVKACGRMSVCVSVCHTHDSQVTHSQHSLLSPKKFFP